MNVKETTKVEYRIQGEQHGLWLTNKPPSPEYANYNAMRSRAAVINGLDDIDIDWEKHDIEVTTYKIQETRKKVKMKDLKEVKADE